MQVLDQCIRLRGNTLSRSLVQMLLLVWSSDHWTWWRDGQNQCQKPTKSQDTRALWPFDPMPHLWPPYRLTLESMCLTTSLPLGGKIWLRIRALGRRKVIPVTTRRYNNTSRIQEAEERRTLQTPMQEMLFQSSRHFGEISINGTEISIGNSEVVCWIWVR